MRAVYDFVREVDVALNQIHISYQLLVLSWYLARFFLFHIRLSLSPSR
jgi:hypothetical protein